MEQIFTVICFRRRCDMWPVSHWLRREKTQSRKRAGGKKNILKGRNRRCLCKAPPKIGLHVSVCVLCLCMFTKKFFHSLNSEHLFINSMLIFTFMFSVISFCELVNSLLRQAQDSAQTVGHLPEGILEVSPRAQRVIYLNVFYRTPSGL